MTVNLLASTVLFDDNNYEVWPLRGFGSVFGCPMAVLDGTDRVAVCAWDYNTNNLIFRLYECDTGTAVEIAGDVAFSMNNDGTIVTQDTPGIVPTATGGFLVYTIGGLPAPDWYMAFRYREYDSNGAPVGAAVVAVMHPGEITLLDYPAVCRSFDPAILFHFTLGGYFSPSPWGTIRYGRVSTAGAVTLSAALSTSDALHEVNRPIITPFADGTCIVFWDRRYASWPNVNQGLWASLIASNGSIVTAADGVKLYTMTAVDNQYDHQYIGNDGTMATIFIQDNNASAGLQHVFTNVTHNGSTISNTAIDIIPTDAAFGFNIPAGALYSGGAMYIKSWDNFDFVLADPNDGFTIIDQGIAEAGPFSSGAWGYGVGALNSGNFAALYTYDGDYKISIMEGAGGGPPIIIQPITIFIG